MSSSSSDSDSSDRVRNIKFLLVKSKTDQQATNESNAYKRRQGDLIFNANFEGGNLGYVERVDEFNYDMMVRPDIANPRLMMWFNFTVSNQRLNQCVIFTFANLIDNLALFHKGLTPVVRCRKQPNWTRLHEDQVFYYRSIHHGSRYVLSIVFRFGSFDNEHQFALFYPYNFSTLRSFISRWSVNIKRAEITRLQQEKRRQLHSIRTRSQTPDQMRESHANKMSDIEELRTRSSLSIRSTKSLALYKSNDRKQKQRFSEFVKFETVDLSTSILYKPIYQLRISCGGSSSTRPKAIVLCRFGGNLDSVASYVCQGIMDFVLSDHSVALAARNLIEFFVFPMLDPDSICAGNSASDILGQSIITSKLVEANKSIYGNWRAVQSKIADLCSSSSTRVILIELGIELHLIGSRVRGTYYEDTLRMERHLSFPRVLARFADDFYLENCNFPKQTDALKGQFFGLLAAIHANLDHYKLDVSPFAYYRRSLAKNDLTEYDQIKYLSLGKATVYSLVELFRVRGKQLPNCADEILDSFSPDANDIDDLSLSRTRVGRV